MSASGHGHHGTIENPGTFEVSGRLKAFFVICVLIGVATFFAGLSTDPNRTWASYLTSHFYFMSMALGGLFIAAINWVTSAMWSAPVRRISESFTAYLPIALVSIAVMYFGMHHLYAWTDPAHMGGEAFSHSKNTWLSIPFFLIRDLFAVVLWILFTMKLVGNSIRQDTTKEARLTLSNKSWSPLFLIVFTLSYTIVSFDHLMSLEPHWFSTMFGVYCFAGLFYGALALTCLVTLFLQSQGKLDGIVNDNHLHDIGKFMFAFTIFWAYIGFAQFLLIWYANMPEETVYFVNRFHGGWIYVSAFLLIGKFMVPFFLLLGRDAKRDRKMLAIVGIWMMIAQWIDVYWMVQPDFFADGPHFGWIEIGGFLGFFGLFAIAVSRFFAKNNIVAIGDPKLAQAVFHHHQ